MIRKIAFSIFKFFASLQLAIFLLLALGIVFAIGTFTESTSGTEVAKLAVYQSPWMNLFLIFLALNLAAAALDRLPWKQKHVGFVVTHAGIILILAGALLTRAYGMEGQMAITEGQTESRMIVNQPMLQIFSKDSAPLALFRMRPRAFPWKGREILESVGMGSDSVPRAALLSYFPKSSRRQEIHESPDGSAALQVTLQSSFLKQTHWLILDDSAKNKISLGPAELRFTREPIQVEKKTKSSSAEGTLEFQFENSAVKIPLPEKTPKKIPLEGTPYQITVLKIYKDAAVDSGKLVEQSEKWNNPACELLLEGNGIQEKHTVFSKFPDFPTMHGMKPSAAGVKIYFRRPEETETANAKNELRFVWQGKGPPLYQIRKGEEISGGELKLNQNYPTGWMDFKFRVEKYYPHAEARNEFKEEPVNSQAEDHLSSLEIELEKNGEKKSFWLGQGDRETVNFGGEFFQMVYGLRTVPVGFRLELKDFRVENYPGTNRPASFESDVILKDDATGTVRDVNIRMNHPLKYRGFKVFQSGYQALPGQPEVSIFTVAKDPGVIIKYIGAVVLISGILIMFYSRRFSSRPKKELAIR